MVVACEQKRLGDDLLELDFQAVVDFLMRGWEPLGLLQEQCVLSTAEPSCQPQMGLFVQSRASSSGCLAVVCSGLVVLDSGEAFYKLVPTPFSLLETLSCMNTGYF